MSDELNSKKPAKLFTDEQFAAMARRGTDEVGAERLRMIRAIEQHATMPPPMDSADNNRQHRIADALNEPFSQCVRKPLDIASAYFWQERRLCMQTAEQILEVLRNHGPELARLGVRRLGLFGSAARGEATDASDLDFLVELNRKTFDAYMDVKEALEVLFGRRIDLVVAEAVKPQLRPRILRETIYAEGL